MRAAPDCRPPLTARHVLHPRSSSTSHPPQQQDEVHRELRPGTGKGARAGAGPLRRTARPAAGLARAPPPPPPSPPTQPLATRSLSTTTGRRKGGHPVVSNRPLHHAMQQRCHHASASARSPSWPPMPRPRLQRAATARREKVQLRIREQSFYLVVAITTHGEAKRDFEFIGGDKDRQLKKLWTETRINSILPWDDIEDEAERLLESV
jgi:hypothetical protein